MQRRIATLVYPFVTFGLAMLMAGCQGFSPIPLQPTRTPVPTRDPNAPTPTAIVIEIHAETDTPAPTATIDPDAPTATPEPLAGAITMNNVEDVEKLRELQASPSALGAVTFSPTENLFAIFGFDKTVRVYDPDDFSREYELLGHGDYGFAAAWSPDGALLATGGGYEVVIWDMQTGQNLSTTQIQQQRPLHIAWSPDSQQLAVVAPTYSHLYIVGRDGGIIEDIQLNRSVIWSVAYSPDGATLALVNAASHLITLDTTTYEIINDTYLGGSATAWDIAYSPDGSMLGMCMSGGSVMMLDASNSSRLWLEEGHTDDCSDSEWNHAGDVYFTGGGDGLLIGWQANNGAKRLIRNLTRFIWGVSVSHDDRFVVTAMDDGEVIVLGLPQ